MKENVKKRIPILVLLMGILLFLFTGKSSSAFDVLADHCDCMGSGFGWVDGSCYLRAIEEECNNELWMTTKTCTYLENTPPSSCDCEDEELCPDEH